MSGCEKCCGHCGGCGEMVLSQGEIDLIWSLAGIPFLPVARTADDMAPIYLEEKTYTCEEYSLFLQCLEKRGIISIDYGQPLKGFDYSAYDRWKVHGSFALTERGHQVLELLEVQGF